MLGDWALENLSEDYHISHYQLVKIQKYCTSVLDLVNKFYIDSPLEFCWFLWKYRELIYSDLSAWMKRHGCGNF